ncbi:cytidine deaminase [Corallococcus sp. H22C18031201]|uniref:cytidine deaminase n=1 Tax=Citreicoccus inhibens TaxID=2849499 RepID=UPI000E76FBC0|nr:cytidine deaminase [Citreicoccus inhibens]MBU8899312.1 cytidine deaminase [Citreicoccus inhibens]RJS25788.1 cytidine deaminase [Corallococcus sp. H22C18031201]
MAEDIPWERLFEEATRVRQRAHVPYSRFPVGAAVLYADGSVVAGCNVENATYGLTVCAERGAFAAGVAQGRASPVAVAIVVDTPEPCPPCGMCRQVMAEFARPGLPVRSRNLKGDEARYSLAELLPHAFTRDFL